MNIFNNNKSKEYTPECTHKYINSIGGEVKCYQLHNTFFYDGAVFGKRWILKPGEILVRNENGARIVLNSYDISPIK
jgi:hypothetical protein